MPNVKFVSLVILELLAFNAQKFMGSRDPVKFGALNANSFKMVEGMKFKFGTDAPRESPDMIPEKFFRKGGVARVT